ncbi:hypothetical protein IM41_07205 [Fervidobacterium sp. SC_NGM5_G05]|nr:hypothetical protein IM41_07205 [Fervidobacterium sp. SC_NGM5_G05]
MKFESKKVSAIKKRKKNTLKKIFFSLFFVVLIFGILFAIYNLAKFVPLFANSTPEKSKDKKVESKVISYNDSYEVRFHKVIKDGKNIIAIGTVMKDPSLKYQLLVVSFDENGNVKWKTEFGKEGDEWGYDILKSNNGYIALGVVSSKSLNVNGRYDALVLNISNSGDVISYKVYGGPDWDRAYKLLKVKDGYVFAGDNFMKGGDILENFGEHDYWIAKIDSKGTLLWSKSFGGIRWDRAYSTDYDAETDTIIVVGSSNSFTDGTRYEGYVLAYDSNGTLKWKTFLSNLGTIWPTSASIANSKIYVGGYAYENGSEKSFIAMLNPSGKVEYIKTFADKTRINAIKVKKTEKQDIVYFAGYKDNGTKQPWYGQFIFSSEMTEPVLVEYSIDSEYGMLFDILIEDGYVITSGSTMEKGKAIGLIKAVPEKGL